MKRSVEAIYGKNAMRAKLRQSAAQDGIDA
jgi:hypothetical protein